MKVKDLKKMLENVDEELEVLLPGGRDHSYLTTEKAQVCQAGHLAKNKRFHCYDPEFVEWFDEKNASPGEVCVNVFVIW